MMLIGLAALVAIGASAYEFIEPASDAQLVDQSYIVVLDAAKVEAAAHTEVAAQLKGKSVRIGATFAAVLVDGVERAALEAQLSTFAPLVKYVEQNARVWALDGRACADQRQPVSWGQVRVSGGEDPNENDDFVHDPEAGKGTIAYITDTGIQITHEDFAGKATWGANFVDSSDSDGNGHGTHVASTIGGQTWGVSKGIDELIAVKVLGASGGGTWAGVISGIEYTASNAAERGMLGKATNNMSLGGGRNTAVNDATDAAVDAGVLQIVAGGNSNTDACNSSPAGAQKAITVGSSDLGNSGGQQVDIRSYFSNYGSCTQIFAPGSDITGAWIGADNRATRTISGTSMASPHVAGIVNTLLAKGVAAGDILDALESNAHKDVIDLNCSNASCNSSPNLLLHEACE